MIYYLRRIEDQFLILPTCGCLFIKNISPFLIPQLISHNKLTLTKFGRFQSFVPYFYYYLILKGCCQSSNNEKNLLDEWGYQQKAASSVMQS